MNFINASLLFFFIVLHHYSAAQDIINFTHFYLNPSLINSSYVGIDGKTAISLHYRNQWSTIQGGPKVATFSLQSPVTERTSIGLTIANDKRGILIQSGVALVVGYNVLLGEFSHVRFGISVGSNWNTIDLEKLQGFSDDALGNVINKSASVTGSAGISYHLKAFHVGISLPTILTPSYVNTDAFTVTEVNPTQAIIINASNRFYFNNNKNIFEPYILYRINNGLPPQFELTNIIHLNHVLWFGASYKQDFGMSALAGIKVKNTLAIGASYSLKNSGINELNSPTTEIVLGYLVSGKNKKKASSPPYSFVNTVKDKKKKLYKSASEVVAEKRKQDEAQRRKQEVLAKKKETIAVPLKNKNSTTEVAKSNKEQVPDNKEQIYTSASGDANTQTKKETISVAHKPRFSQIDIQRSSITTEVTVHSPEDEKERISRIELHQNKPTAQHEHRSDYHPNSERHEFAKKGTHNKEMKVSDYVISGVFKEEQHAKEFSKGLKKMGFSTNYGHLTEKSVWYVYIFDTNDILVAKVERDKFRKMKIFRDAWLLTVQD
jgi:type IX secretion system PorP/SprF family membrane protein